MIKGAIKPYGGDIGAFTESYTIHLVVDYYIVYLVEDHMFRSIMHINTPLIMNMNMLCE